VRNKYQRKERKSNHKFEVVQGARVDGARQGPRQVRSRRTSPHNRTCDFGSLGCPVGSQLGERGYLRAIVASTIERIGLGILVASRQTSRPYPLWARPSARRRSLVPLLWGHRAAPGCKFRAQEVQELECTTRPVRDCPQARQPSCGQSPKPKLSLWDRRDEGSDGTRWWSPQGHPRTILSFSA